MQKIYIGSDHAGFEHKEAIKKYLESTSKYEVFDCGPFNDTSVDYPDYGLKVAINVSSDENNRGILICGTGIGMSIIANKVSKIRAALVYDPEIAKITREHNNSNIIALGGRVNQLETNLEIVKNFLNTSFDAGRHAKRIQKINEYEGE